MPRGKKELAEQIIPKLREVEVEVGRGKTELTVTVNPGRNVADFALEGSLVKSPHVSPK